jgi:hypothetical protein
MNRNGPIPRKVDSAIDRFVERLTREGSHFTPVASAPWIDTFEDRLPAKLPRSFSSLVRRYSFPSFEFAGVTFFSNLGTADEEDLANAVFRDRHLAAAVANGFVQIGRPETGSYDLVCFNTRDRRAAECPLVVLDHEELLQHDKVRVTSTVARSFLELIKSADH